MKRLENKVAIITGAAMGQGAAEAYLFAKEGAKVVAADMAEDALKETVDAINADFPGMALGVHLDVASEENWQQVVKQAVETFGTVDILVNNAGIAEQKLFTDVTAAEWDEMMAVHVRGAFLCCKAALPHMIRQKWGRIINISSMWGQVGASCEVPYSAAKAALIGMTKALAKEEGPSGVTVNCIAPGAVDTEMMAGFSAQDKAALCEETPLCRLGTPQDIAAAVAFLASEQAGFVTGQVLGVNGGFVV